MRKERHPQLGNIVDVHPRYTIVNIRYEVNDYHFDAAVDVDLMLHDYNTCFEINWQNCTAIELYNLDRTDWDVKMIYQNIKNNRIHTFVDMNNIIEETKKWIEEMEKYNSDDE